MRDANQRQDSQSKKLRWVRSASTALTAQAVILVLLALATAWTVAFTSYRSRSTPPAAAASATTTPRQQSVPSTAAQSGRSTVAGPEEQETDASFATSPGSRIEAAPTRSAAFEVLLEGRRVHVIGDSLVLSARNELTSIFGDSIDVRAESGLGLYYASTWIAAAARDPDIVVVALGTNDWNAPDAFVGSAREALDTLSAASCVVWVDVQLFKPAIAGMNAGLLEISSELGTHVASWSSVAGPSELHAPDGYHLSALGQELFAGLIAATVEANCL